MAEENKNTDDQQEQGGQETLEQKLDQTQEFLEHNKGALQKILIAIIIVLGGYVVLKNFVWGPADTASQEALWEAQYVFETDSFGQATELFSDLKEEYSSTDAGNISNLYLGISLMKEGAFDEAIEALDDYNGEGYLLPAVGEGLKGDCYSELEAYDDAVKSYKKAARLANSNVYSPYFLKKTGLVYEELAETEKAAEAYQEILDQYYYEGIVEFSKERKEIVVLLARAKGNL